MFLNATRGPRFSVVGPQQKVQISMNEELERLLSKPTDLGARGRDASVTIFAVMRDVGRCDRGRLYNNQVEAL